MSRTGPLPFPTAVKAARGTLRADRANPREPAALPIGRVKAPAWLDAAGVVAFAWLVSVLRRTRVLGAQDLPLLAVLADQMAQYEQAARVLGEKGSLSYVVLDGDGAPKGVQAFPEVKIKAAAASEIRRLSEHFGLSPASRARVTAAEPGAATDAASVLQRKYFGA